MWPNIDRREKDSLRKYGCLASTCENNDLECRNADTRVDDFALEKAPPDAKQI